KMDPIDWGYNNSGPGSGALPDDFDEPRIRFFRFDRERMTTEFIPGLQIPLGPFQGILGVQPAGDQPASSGPPGPYGGNMDLRELIEGTALYVPVFHPGGKLWTSDSHAAQGDGEARVAHPVRAAQAGGPDLADGGHARALDQPGDAPRPGRGVQHQPAPD